MKPLLLIILICLISSTALGQEPEKSDEPGAQELVERIRQELEQIKQQLKSIGESQDRLQTDRDKLKQLVINNNEIIALKKLLVIARACESFRANRKPESFPRRFKQLKDYLPEKIINATNASGAIYGYYYKYKYVNKERFRLKALPAVKGKTGGRTFALDEAGLIVDDETGEPISLGKEKD